MNTKENISDIMQSAYIDYSMSVIVSRALPDVRDGLSRTTEGIVRNVARRISA